MDDTIEMNGYTITIRQEESANDPRAEFDHATLMYCEHRRYNLGDKASKQVWNDHSGFVKGQPVFFTLNDFLTNGRRAGCEIMALYLYDHSGITMRCEPFDDPWDSSQVGIIYMTEAMIREAFQVKRISQATRRKARELMESEVDEYDQYLTGDVWYYVIEDQEGHVIDSCGRMYGYDYCEQSAREVVKGLPFQLTLPLEEE